MFCLCIYKQSKECGFYALSVFVEPHEQDGIVPHPEGFRTAKKPGLLYPRGGQIDIIFAFGVNFRRKFGSYDLFMLCYHYGSIWIQYGSIWSYFEKMFAYLSPATSRFWPTLITIIKGSILKKTSSKLYIISDIL